MGVRAIAVLSSTALASAVALAASAPAPAPAPARASTPAPAPLPSPAPAATPPTDPRSGAIGLLALPELFGTEPCQRFHPQAVPIQGGPGAAPAIGELRTTSAWRYPEEGGCEGLRVEFVPSTGAPAELPAQEFAYEQPAAIVLEVRGDWYRVRLPEGDGWLHAAARDEFVPLQALLERETVVFTARGPITLRTAPGDDTPLAWNGAVTCAAPRVIGTDQVAGRRWLDVELTRDDCCAEDSATVPAAPVRGWLPLRRDDGVPSVWIAARGC